VSGGRQADGHTEGAEKVAAAAAVQVAVNIHTTDRTTDYEKLREQFNLHQPHFHVYRITLATMGERSFWTNACHAHSHLPNFQSNVGRQDSL
jgi:cysteine sulfinate desulfinase/cysteine desulfurase-like protein